MKEIFDTYVENSFDSMKQAEFKFEQFKQNYRKFFPRETHADVLDIGIGRGEMLSCFEKWGYHNYLGIDISPSTVNFCQTLNLKCQVVQDTGEYLRSKKECFDVITLIDVLEHIPREQVVTFLKDIRFALKNGGKLIVQVPNLQAPEGQIHMFNDITHHVGYVEHSLQQVLITSGFKRWCFQGFEEFVQKNFKTYLKKFLRKIYWKQVRFKRAINGNINADILNPVFSVIVEK